jgi:hypothetical protein
MAGWPGTCLYRGMLAAFNPVLLVLPAMLALVVLVIWMAKEHARKTREALHAFAQRAGLRIQEQTVLGFTSVQSLEGEQAGRAVRYWTYSTGSGKSRTTWVAVAVRPRAEAGLQFDLTRQNFGSKIMEMFGVKEIKVGDPAFDAAWFVRTNQPDFLAAALVPSIRARLMAEPAGRWGARYKLENGLVQYVEQGHLSSAEVLARLERQLPLLHELADVAEVFAGTGR